MLLLGRHNLNVHSCELERDEIRTSLPPLPPFSPWYRTWGRRVRMWTILSDRCHKTRYYYPSVAQVQREKVRHLTTRRLRFSIHPFSRLAICRQWFMMFVWIFLLAYEPYVDAIDVLCLLDGNYTETEIDITPIKEITCCIALLDIVLNFFLGYVIKETMVAELDPKRIVLHYMRTYFLCDVTALIIDFVNVIDVADRDFTIRTKALHCVRLFRICTLLGFIKNTLKTFNVKESTITLLNLFITNLYMLHWFTSVLFFLPRIIHNTEAIPDTWQHRGYHMTKWSSSTHYWEALLVVTCHYYGAYTQNYLTANVVERYVLTCVLITGYVHMMYYLAIGLQFFGTANFSEAKYEQFYSQVCDYMQGKKFPMELRDRIQSYYEHKFRKRFFVENVILDTLSLNLRYEILLFDCRNLLAKVNLLKKLPKSAVGTILPMMKHEIYLPGDAILKCDDLNENIFFVSYGTIGLFFVDTRQEVCHFEDGMNFGQNHILMRLGGQIPFYDLIALEVSEVYTVDIRLLKWIFREHPDFKDYMDDTASKRMEFYNLTFAQRRKDMKTDYIVNELRKKRILERVRSRELNM